jgi:RND family efflux transporter MFP subunit
MTTTIPKRRRRRRWPWFLLVAILLGVGGIAVYSRTTHDPDRNGVKVEDLDLRLGKSEIADVQVAVHEVGTVEPAVKVDVKSTLSGKVTELLVREGDRVKRGQVLARVEPDVNQAQTLSEVRSTLKLAEIRAEDARKNLENQKRLHSEGYVSTQGLQAYQVEHDTALEALEAAKTKLRIVEESGIPLDSEISTTQRVNIVSPMNGTVIQKNVEVGQTVTSGVSSFNEGTIIYTVADLASMLIKASVNEVDIGRIRLDMPAVITVDAFAFRKFDGRVSHISPAARLKDKIKVFDIEVELAEQVPDLRAGMTANVEIRGERVDDTLSVPVEAVFEKEDRQIVYVLKQPFDPPKEGERQPRTLRSGKLDVADSWQRFFEEREVDIGLVSLERAQVESGLTEGIDIALEDPTKPREIEDED